MSNGSIVYGTHTFVSVYVNKSIERIDRNYFCDSVIAKL